SGKKRWNPKREPKGQLDTIRVFDTAGKRRRISLGPIGSPEADRKYKEIVALMEANGRRYPEEGLKPTEAATKTVEHEEKGNDTTEPALEAPPAANLFPMMSEDEFRVFKEDIRIRGLEEDIVFFEGKILDGRNRYRACRELG